jgi:hypothetical protein
MFRVRRFITPLILQSFLVILTRKNSCHSFETATVAHRTDKETALSAKNMSRIEHLLALSDEILADLESEILSFEKILAKCKRLARLRDDSKHYTGLLLN